MAQIFTEEDLNFSRCNHICLNMKHKKEILEYFTERDFWVIEEPDKIVFKF
jgi:hypothetical protein